jgi:hypothetical protein
MTNPKSAEETAREVADEIVSWSAQDAPHREVEVASSAKIIARVMHAYAAQVLEEAQEEIRGVGDNGWDVVSELLIREREAGKGPA